MLAYNFENNKHGVLGFDMLNLFTDDDVYCSNFSPTNEDVAKINDFLKDLKLIFPLKKSVSLYVAFKDGHYLGDAKIYLGEEPTFANSSHKSLEQLLLSLKNYLIVNSVYEMDKGYRYLN